MQRPKSDDKPHWSQGLLGPLMATSIVLGVIGLPLVLWLDLTALSERTLPSRASETSRVIDIMRGFYSSDVVSALSILTEQRSFAAMYQAASEPNIQLRL